MTDAVATTPRRPDLVAIGRIPATLTLIAVLLAVGVVFAGLWSPFEDSPLYETVAYGLPALIEGRWWTPVTGTLFVRTTFTSSWYAGTMYANVSAAAAPCGTVSPRAV